MVDSKIVNVCLVEIILFLWIFKHSSKKSKPPDCISEKRAYLELLNFLLLPKLKLKKDNFMFLYKTKKKSHNTVM